MRLGKQIRAWRDAQGLTQEKAAEIAGVAQATWAQWETGDRIPSVKNAPRLIEITASGKKEHRVTLELLAAATKGAA
jgi:transcriptional regulator with XRE-family HTH domain